MKLLLRITYSNFFLFFKTALRVFVSCCDYMTGE